MKVQKSVIALWHLLILIVLLVGCGKAPQSAPPISTEIETIAEIETTQPDPFVNDSNVYLAYQFEDGQKKFGYINRTGEFVIEPIYSYGTDFSEGFAIVSYNDIYQVIDPKGNVLFENEGIIEPFQNGMAAYTDQGTYKTGYIDTSGKVILKPTYLTATPFNADGNAIVSSTADRLTVIDKSGKSVKEIELESEYTGLYDIKDGFAIYISSTQEGSKLGVVSLEGQTIIPPEYNGITNLGNGLFAIKDPSREFYDLLDTPSAIFDQSGVKLTDYIYYDIKPYQGDYASATNETDTFFIGLDGTIASSHPKIKGLGTLTFTGNLIKADIDGELTYLTEAGAVAWKADSTYKLTATLTIKQNKERLHRTALIYYPSISGLEDDQVQADINANLKALFIDIRSEESLDGLSVEDQFDASLNKDLLTIHKSGYDYPSGAAHGMPIRDYYHFNLKTGKLFSLQDLFLDNSRYMEKLDTILVDAIQESFDSGNTMVFPESFKGLTEDTNFIFTKDALIIYFYPYDIAAYAAGFQEFSIPYQDLMDIIDVEGELWKSFEQ